METFIVLHRGPDISSAKPIAVTNNPLIVVPVAERLLREREAFGVPADPILGPLEAGRMEALRAVVEGMADVLR